MSTFSKATFNALSYAASRPTYPRALFDYIFCYHRAGAGPARWDTAVDLGCGTGRWLSGTTIALCNIYYEWHRPSDRRADAFQNHRGY